MRASLFDLERRWFEHPVGHARALGGRRSLSGFSFQLFVSLDRFVDHVLQGHPDAAMTFESLSDLTEAKDDLLYMTQVKLSLTSGAIRSAVREILDVDTFLAEDFPELQPKFRYQICTRNARTQSASLHLLTADELGLHGGQAQQWHGVRSQVLGVSVRANPLLDLAIKLFPHSTDTFRLIDLWAGETIRLLAQNEPSEIITNVLLQEWDASRAVQPPPGKLLTPEDFVPATISDRILVGQRPGLSDLNEGCFMELPGRLDSIMSPLVQALNGSEDRTRERGLGVFWLVGGSGVGKSVLLLQTMRRILEEDLAVVHHLDHFTTHLPAALRYWSKSTRPVLIVIDDMFAPDSRRRELWDELHAIGQQTSWIRRPLILTCGSTDDARAFERETLVGGGFHLVTTKIGNLSEYEQAAYAAWYSARTNYMIDPTRNKNFVLAALMFEIRRAGNSDVGEFAARLHRRLVDIDVAPEVLSTLAINRLGLMTHIAQFADKEDQIRQLASDGIALNWRPESNWVRLFHPKVATAIYDYLVPEERVAERAGDVHRYISKIMSVAENVARSALEACVRRRGNRGISEDALQILLERTWYSLEETEAPHVPSGVLIVWRNAVRTHGMRLSRERIIARVRKWMNSAAESSFWGILWSVAWEFSDSDEHDELRRQGVNWLSTSSDYGSWNYVWQALWDGGADSTILRRLGLNWLRGHDSHPGWSYVFQRLRDSDIQIDDLRDIAISGLRNSPLSNADPYIWKKARDVICDDKIFVRALCGRFCKYAGRDDLRVKAGVEIAEFCKAGGIADVCMELEDNLSSPGWASLFDVLWPRLRWRDIRAQLEQVGRTWVEASSASPDWAIVWSRIADPRAGTVEMRRLGGVWVAEHGDAHRWWDVWSRLMRWAPEDELLIQLGIDWLPGREDLNGWFYIWRRLLDNLDAPADLLSKGHEWLAGRESHSNWPFTWHCLLERDADRRVELGEQGRAWLIEHEDAPRWSETWEALTKYFPESDDLRAIGRSWLLGREDLPRWYYVWHRLTELEAEDSRLIGIGKAWLVHRELNPAWPDVFRRLADIAEFRGQLAQLGIAWLASQQDNVQWIKVWQTLGRLDIRYSTLMRAGKDWLRGRERNPEWPQVWRILYTEYFYDRWLDDKGREWIRSNRNNGAWDLVWHTLLSASPTDRELINQGRGWLASHENASQWPHVWRMLYKQLPSDRQLSRVALSWLKHRPSNASWTFVFVDLAQGAMNDALLALGTGWLDLHSTHPRAAAVRACLWPDGSVDAEKT